MKDEAPDSDIERQLEVWAASHSGAQIPPELVRKVRQELKPSLRPVKLVKERLGGP